MFSLIPVAAFLRVLKGAVVERILKEDINITEGKIPLPPEAPDGSVQPVGCGSPTFTGSSFDLQEVALTGVRLAVATLSPADKYGNVEWDIANLSLREKDKFLLPEWTPVTLEKYTDCSCAQET